MAIQRPGIVQIVNPAPDGSQYTSQKAARQYVQRGRAIWQTNRTAIRFIDQVQDTAADACADDRMYRWRRGVTGGMAQIIGSAALVIAAVAGPPASDMPVGTSKKKM